MRSNTTSSINTSLPPPRFNPGSESTIRESLQNDPVLKLIPMKRARSREKSRAYRIIDGPVTENWESEFEVWAQQEISILAGEDAGLAAAETSLVFGMQMDANVKAARALLKLKKDANDFRKAKEMVAKTLNRRRLVHNLQAPLIPIEEPCQRSSPPEPPPPQSNAETQRALSEPRDVKPKIPQNDSEGQRQGTGGTHARARTQEDRPQASNQSATVSPNPFVAPNEPQPKQYKLQGMDQPFPPFLVEVYLHTRQGVQNPAQGFIMIKNLFSEWTRSVGDTNASRHIFDLECLAADEAKLGGPRDEEKRRRGLCSRIFCNKRMSQRSTEGAANRSRSNSRQTSPIASGPLPPLPPLPPPQQSSAPPSPAPTQGVGNRVCRKCKSESLTCDGEDPCSECVARGRYHLCTFPEEPPPLLPPLPSLPPLPTPSPAVISQEPPPVSQSPPPLRNSFPRPAPSQPEPPRMSPPLVHSSSLLSQSRGGREENENVKNGGGITNSSSTDPIQASAPPPHSRTFSYPPQGQQTVSLEQARSWARETQARHQQQLDSQIHYKTPRAVPTPPTIPQSAFTTPPLQQMAFPTPQPQTHPPTHIVNPRPIPSSQHVRQLTQDSGPPPSQSPQSSPNPQTSLKWSPYVVPPTSGAPPPGPYQSTPPLARIALSPADQAPPPRSRNNSETSSNLQRSLPPPPSQQQQQPSQQRQIGSPNSIPIKRFQTPAWQNFLQGLPPVLSNLQNLSTFFSTLRTPPAPNSSAPPSRSNSLGGK
ncbi:hypothetical protein JCM3765_002735 [Sporobolomyces pararoseus]